MKYVISVIFIFCIHYSSWAIKQDRVYIRKPEEMGLMYKSLNVVTKDGYKIETWFFPTQNALNEQEIAELDGEKRKYSPLVDTSVPTIIICNGDAGNMSYYQLHLVQTWTQMGLNVVTFDWRGFGSSSPFPMNENYLCYTEMLEDYDAVVKEVAKQNEVKKNAIAVMGWSTGSYLSMITAYNNETISAFIGRSLPTDFEDFIPLVMKVRNKTRDQLLIPDDFPREKMPIYISKTFSKPMFLIVGSNDIRTPVWMSKKVINNLPKSTPRQLMIVKGAGHGGYDDPIMKDYDNFTYNVKEFLNKHL